jgi:hypothetical protein
MLHYCMVDLWQLIEWSYSVDLLCLIHDWSANLVCRQRRLEAKMISLRDMTCVISCLLVGVGTRENF